MYGAPITTLMPVLTFSPNATASPSHDGEIARLAAEMAVKAKKKEARAALDASKAAMTKRWTAWFKREHKVHETAD
jgi:hypothetical protein